MRMKMADLCPGEGQQFASSHLTPTVEVGGGSWRRKKRAKVKLPSSEPLICLEKEEISNEWQQVAHRAEECSRSQLMKSNHSINAKLPPKITPDGFYFSKTCLTSKNALPLFYLFILTLITSNSSSIQAQSREFADRSQVDSTILLGKRQTLSTATTASSQPPGNFSAVDKIVRLDEEEVDLFRPSPNVALNGGRERNSHQPPDGQARIYRIKTDKFNGKLQLPLKMIDLNDGPIKVRPREKLQPNETETSPGRAAAAAASSSASRPQFGARSSKLSHGKQTSPQVEANCEQVSIAASSPTLKLLTTGANQINSSPGSSSSKNIDQLADGSNVELPVNLLGLRIGRQPALIGDSSAQVSPSRIGSNLASALQLSSSSLMDPETSTASNSADSILSLIDEFDSKIITNRTKAQLSCDSGEMILRLNFSEPFKGIVYPNHERLSPCRFFGDGHLNYELRLPLRGCGTKQVAQRVFVNDVIVRFHKTLELEEDEVKTLICRYPPPLAPPPAAESVGPPNRHSSSSSIEQEGAPIGQFEFVSDSQGGANYNGGRTRPEPADGSGNIETFSENLMVAPLGSNPLGGAGGSNPNQRPNLNQRLGSLGSGPTSRANLRQQPPVDLFNQRDSNGNSNVASDSQPTTAGDNFLERLSSIELLFLISSLMFLVLLALGLAGSYYCFRRQTERGASRRASAILKSRRRYLGGSAPMLSSASQTANLGYYGKAQSQLITAPSSPESDLSGRNLLSAATTMTNENPHQAYMFNRAYLPDQQQQHYLAPGSFVPHPQLIGNHQRPSSGSFWAAQDPACAIATKPQVLGRRADSSYGISKSAGGVYGQPAMGSQRHYSHNRHLYRMDDSLINCANQQSATMSKLRPRPSQHSEAGVRSLRVKGRNGSPGTGPNHHHPLQQQQQLAITPARYALGPGTVRRTNQGRSLIAEEANSPLWRAKSLSSVARPPDAQVDLAELAGDNEHERRLTMQDHRPAIGATLSRYDTGAPGERQWRGHDSSNYANLIGRQESGGNGEFGQSGSKLSNPNPWSALKLDPANNLGTKGKIRAKEKKMENDEMDSDRDERRTKSRLLLKSVEDSYITNLTEIYEQEYMKRDSTRPFSISEWRASQTKVKRERKEEKSDWTDSESDSESKEDKRHQSTGNHETSATAQSNLRSLTELDVNFAKSMLVGNSSTKLAQTSSTNKQNSTDESSKNTSSNQEKNDDDDEQIADLILSPDYDHSRLELETSAHNTVSYV